MIMKMMPVMIVNNDVPRYERRRSHVLREKKRHGEIVDPSLSCNSYLRSVQYLQHLPLVDKLGKSSESSGIKKKTRY